MAGLLVDKTDEDREWDDDAQRVNAMADMARRTGVIIECGEDEPPTLNEDGTLQEDVPSTDE